MLDHREKEAKEASPETAKYAYLTYDPLRRMIRQMDDECIFDDIPFSLVHQDLFPHNMLISAEEDYRGGPVLSAFLDWDRAMVLPAFELCQPPEWLWAWPEDGDENESTATVLPEDEEGREIKAIFDAAAGFDVVRLAYAPEYRLARVVMTFALWRVTSQEMLKQGEKAVDEWEKVRAEMQAMWEWLVDFEDLE
jgi:hypothetical protein